MVGVCNKNDYTVQEQLSSSMSIIRVHAERSRVGMETWVDARDNDQHVSQVLTIGS